MIHTNTYSFVQDYTQIHPQHAQGVRLFLTLWESQHVGNYIVTNPENAPMPSHLTDPRFGYYFERLDISDEILPPKVETFLEDAYVQGIVMSYTIKGEEAKKTNNTVEIACRINEAEGTMGAPDISIDIYCDPQEAISDTFKILYFQNTPDLG